MATYEVEGEPTFERRAAALLRLVDRIVAAVHERAPDQIRSALKNIAAAVAELPPDLLIAFATPGTSEPSETCAEARRRVMDTVARHMSDTTIARFVARQAFTAGAPIERLAHAFQALVRDHQRRERLLDIAHAEALNSGEMPPDMVEGKWPEIAERLLTSYSDEAFVSEDYGRELSRVPAIAMSVEQVSDDPPERVDAWLATVASTELRKLDLVLLLDVMGLEEEHDKWSALVCPVLSLVDDLCLVGDFDAARQLVGRLATLGRPDSADPRRAAANEALDRLAGRPALQHLVAHLATVSDEQFGFVEELCLALGHRAIAPLTAGLASEQRTQARARLVQLLVQFGAPGRREVEQLTSSPNVAVRRTAVYLLGHVGGADVLPQLSELVGDADPQVQREAIRAILHIGTDRAFEVLQAALVGGNARVRQSLIATLTNTRDERTAPLFAYLVEHLDHRGPLAPIYLRAIDALGASKDPEGIPALQKALRRGEWWAPRRSALLRGAAAAALARIGTAPAVAALEGAAASGPRGSRAAARAQIARLRGSSPNRIEG
jgi:HEAT repeat protein